MGPGDRRRRPGRAAGAGASPGSALTTTGSARNGAPFVDPWRTCPRTRRRSGAARARAPGRAPRRPRTRSCRRCRARPRSRPAREQLAQTRAHAAHDGLDRRLAVRRAHQRGAVASRDAATCSGRTFEGPQPKRPSDGLRSGGMVSWARSTSGVPRTSGGGAQALGCGAARRAAEAAPSLPGGLFHPATPVTTAELMLAHTRRGGPSAAAARPARPMRTARRAERAASSP